MILIYNNKALVKNNKCIDYDANNNIYAKNSIGKIWGVNRKEGV